MSTNGFNIGAYWAVLTRRWPVIVTVVVLVPLLATILAVGQSKVYSASAQVLLTYSTPGATVTGGALSYAAAAPERNVATQAALARNAAVAREAVALSHLRSTAADLLNHSSVSTVTTADVLNFTVKDSSPQRARELATNYATAYTMYRNGIDSQAIDSAIAGITLQLQQLAGAGQTGSPTFAALSHEQEELTATQAAGTHDAVLVQPASSAVTVSPHPARSAAAGLAVGLVLALVLVFLMETLDRHASSEEISQRLGLPLLAAIPAVRRGRQPLTRRAGFALNWSEVFAYLSSEVLPYLRRQPRRSSSQPSSLDSGRAEQQVASLAVLRHAGGGTANAYRGLEASLEVASIEHDVKSILLASPYPYLGKSTIVANLAVAMAQAGRHVLTCDFDARHSSLSSVFGLEESPGMTDVVLARATLKRSIVSIPSSVLLSPQWIDRVGATTDRRSKVSPERGMPGPLKILPFGGPQPHSGFLGSRAVADLVEQLGSTPADIVLIDAPPLLGSGESLMLSALADAVIVVLPGPVRPPILAELSATLAKLPALCLGFITVGMVQTRGGTAFSDSGDELPVKRIDQGSLAASANGHSGVTSVRRTPADTP